MRTDDLYLAGLATHLPERITTAHAVEQGWYDAAERDRTGLLSIAVAGDVPAPDMTVEAANETLATCGLAREEIAALLHSGVHYQGPDSWSVQHYILRRTVARPITALEVRQGCNGMVANLELAACLLAADPSRVGVLVTSGDNFSTPIVDRWRTCSLFVLGDGAASVVVTRRPGFARLLAVGSAAEPELEPLHRGDEPLFPPGITVGTPLRMEERRSYWLEEWKKGNQPPPGDPSALVADAAKTVLDEAGTDLAGITRVAHMGFARPAIQEAFYEPLGIDAARGTWDLTRRVGHAGPIDVFLGLQELWYSGQVGPGDTVLLIGAAPGMAAHAAVVEIVEPPPAGAQPRILTTQGASS